MYVCLCTGTTDRQIKQAVFEGARSLAELREELGVASQCGQCSRLTKQIVRDTVDEMANSSLYYQAV